MKPITNPNTENTDPEYWEDILESHNLGLHPVEMLEIEDVNVEDIGDDE